MVEENRLTVHAGQVYEYVRGDDWCSNLYLVVSFNGKLARTNNGPLWDVICLDDYDGLEDEWEKFLDNVEYYQRVE